MSTNASSAAEVVDVTVVIPMRNEAPNVAPLVSELRAMMDQQRLQYEVVFVNDGSTDGTGQELERVLHHDDPRFSVVELARQFGQSAALAAGFDVAKGRVVVAMDGDLQNDPRDIPRLVAHLDAHPRVDVVSGWRKQRHDHWLSRRLPSACANMLIRRHTGCPEIHDFGCTLKAYRSEVLIGVQLYGEMHRFLPALCKWQGAQLAEMVVNHRPRVNGQTKYGIGRTLRVLLDLLTVKFLGGYLTKPIYFFGKLALMTFVVAILAVGMAVVQKLGYLTEHGGPVMLNDNIFMFFAMLVTLTTMSLVMMGLISELLIRIYHESQNRPVYRIRQIWRTPGAGVSTAPHVDDQARRDRSYRAKPERAAASTLS